MASTAVVIGAGPGGAAAAVRLGQRGIKKIYLVDKDHFPRDKTCGSALSPYALSLVESLGIAHEIRRLGYPIHSVLLGTPGGRRIKLTTDAAAIVLLRKHFDHLLVQKALSLGAEFTGGFYAKELLRDGTGRVHGVKSRNGDVIYGDYVLLADGAHSIFSHDPRPKRTISTLMGWWENFAHEPHTMEMIFDKNLSPLYGWMFPETPTRINIGICVDGEDANGDKARHDLRQLFNDFLQTHFGDRLRSAKAVGRWKGHPISYTTWVRDLDDNGAVYLGEGGRMTHNATGEGIYHAMQSGVYCADAVADIFAGADEKKRLAQYTWQCRKRFTSGFVLGHLLRGVMKTPLVDWLADAYNTPSLRSAVTWMLASTMVGHSAKDRGGHDDELATAFVDRQTAAGGYRPITAFSQDGSESAGTSN